MNPAPHPFLLTALPSVVREAKQRSEFEPADKTHISFRCLVCPRRCVCKGVRSLETHLKGKRHEKAKRALIVDAFTAGAPQPIAPFKLAAIPFEVTGYDPELHRALAVDVEAEAPKEGGSTSFKCRVCGEDFTDFILQHLRSDRHLKAEAWGLTPRYGIVGPGDGSFRWTVVTGTPPFQPSNFVYRNLAMPRGLMLIFNYCFTGQGEEERHGAKQDSFNLKTLFHRMGYDVLLNEDCSKSRTEEILTETQEDPSLRKYDSFIVFIMSHGNYDQVFYTASGRDEDCMKLDDVRYRFTDTACPALKGKPKLFFVNFFRATREQVAYDGIVPHKPPPEDMVTVYSSINSMSPRNPEYGTYFVQGWCEVLAAHAHNEDLQYLHYRADQRLKEMGAPVQELQSYAFKKFYFNPVDT